MVFIAPFVGAAVFLSGLTAALPTSNSYGSSDSSSSSYGGSSDSSSNSYGGSSDSSSNYGSSDSSNYGSSDSSSSYGGSSNSYGGSSGGSSYGGSNYNNQDTSSSTMMMMDSSTMMMDTTSSTMMMETTTSSAYNSYQTSNYGSGSSYWGGSGYEDCVNQCIAQFGGSSGGGSYQATATSGSYGSVGTGSTHTVIVAPTKGVFRFVPFATNASVGDTIEFHWGADQHTVTKSSQLLPCNKSADAPVFASGEQNKSFVFTQVVNDTNPTFYYCGTPTHCEKGMFGVINPAMATPGSPSSLGGMMSSMAANDSDLSAYAAYSSNATASNDQAASWGSNFDMTNLPAWSHGSFAANVMYTRVTLAMNAEVLKPDNSIDLSSVASTPLMLPMDITPALDAASAAPAAPAAPAADANTPTAAAATGPAAAAAAASSPAASKTGGASALASPRFLVGAVVVLATIFAL